MRNTFSHVLALCLGVAPAAPAIGATIYNNLTPNDLMATASRPDTGVFEIESADDFVLNMPARIDSASFVGLVVPGTTGSLAIAQVVVEIYRVFPEDSNTTRTPSVPTRVNSPSDVAFDSRDSSASGLTFTTSVLAASFTAANSVQAGGIHPRPGQTTGGSGPVTGAEMQFNVTFSAPLTLAANHYFFIPQVAVSNGGEFYWLSSSRPIGGTGTTPFAPDLQSWTRDANLAPDWLRVGTDIIGGQPAPTFNAAFSLEGQTIPEPAAYTLLLGGLALLGIRRVRTR